MNTLLVSTILALALLTDIVNGSEYIDHSSAGFIENKGQIVDENKNQVSNVLFKAEGLGTDIYVTKTGFTCIFSEQIKKSRDPITGDRRRTVNWCRANINLVGANIQRANITADNLVDQGYYNYYLGHCPDGILNIHQYRKLTIKEVYKGIDWIIYYDQNVGLKYDFMVHPGADPDKIVLEYEGAGELSKKDGFISLKTAYGELTEGPLLSYQTTTDQKIHSEYQLNGNKVSFLINDYDRTEMLVIDPPMVLKWATYYGNTGFEGSKNMITDIDGNVYISGYFGESMPFFDPQDGSYMDSIYNGGIIDAFVMKFDKCGIRQWVTYYGGNDNEEAKGIDTDASGTIFLCGYTFSSNFPIQNKGGAYNDASYGGNGDAFVLEFDQNGVRQWATYYGGSEEEDGDDITIDATGSLFLAGTTESSDLSILNLPGAYNQPALGSPGFNDLFLVRFDQNGLRNWATYYGGDNNDMVNKLDMCKNPSGGVLIAGYTTSTNFPTSDPGGGAYFEADLGAGGGGKVFILSINTSCNNDWATYFGGDRYMAIDADLSGNIYLVNTDAFTSPPTVNPGGGAYNQPSSTIGPGPDLYISKFNAAREMTWSTFYGGWGSDVAHNLVLDNLGTFYISGITNSAVFPAMGPPGSYVSPWDADGGNDIMMAQFDTSGVQLWSTYYPGSGTDWCTGSAYNPVSGCFYVTGEHAGFSVSPKLNPGNGAYYQSFHGGGNDDTFIMKFCPDDDPLTLSVSNTDVTCGSTSDGTATAIVGGGMPTYSYSWNDQDNQTTATATGLEPGSYVLMVTDDNCNVQNAFVSIGQAPGMTLDITSDSASCGQPTGIASTTVTGGSGGFQYLWNDVNAQTSATADSLAAGNYTVVVSDASSCIDSISVTIYEINAHTSSVNQAINPVCFSDNNGSIDISVAGGSLPFSYLWNSGQISEDLSNIGPGSYTVTITDANGCTTTETAILTEPTALSTTTDSTDATCGNADGSATATASGGTGPYTYQWDGSANNQTSPTAINLAQGNYNVTITDANGCIETATVIVSNIGGPSLSIPTTSNIMCFGDCNGSATALGSGGTNPLTYLWDDANSQATPIATSLCEGTYNVTVTDANGCSSTETVIITEPQALSLGSVTDSATCGNSDGQATVTATGGTTGYNYQWDGPANNQITPTATNLPLGSYSVVVTDNYGCTDQIIVTIGEIGAPTLSVNDLTFCQGESNSITSTTNNSNVDYLWSTTEITPTITVSTSGNYTLTVTDPFTGCSTQSTSTVTVNPPPTASAWPDTTILAGSSVNVSASGGITCSWTPSTYLSNENSCNPIATPDQTTTYIVTVEDQNGCKNSEAITIIVEEQNFTIFIPNAFSPNGDNSNDFYQIRVEGAIDYHLEIYNRWGEQVFETSDINTHWDGTFHRKQPVQQEVFVYFIKVENTNGDVYEYIGNVSVIR